MTQETKHSKLPFSIVKKEVSGVDCYAIFDPDYKVICSNEFGDVRAPKESDAELFVDAANSYHQLKEQNKMLREALTAVLDDLKSRARWDDEVKVIPLGSSVYLQAEKALAKVKPESDKE